MKTIAEEEHLRVRIAIERQLAATAPSECVRAPHAQMAEIYKQRLAKMRTDPKSLFAFSEGAIAKSDSTGAPALPRR
jgi:hypothetical protein